MAVRLLYVGAPDSVQNDVTITTPSGSFTVGQTVTLSGTVTPSGNVVQVALSNSNSIAPTTGLTSVTPNGSNWSQGLVASASGTWYGWVIDQATGEFDVTGPVTVQDVVVTGSIVLTPPAVSTVHPGDAFTASGTVSPAGTIDYQLVQQASPAPTSGWSSVASNGAGAWSIPLTAPATLGDWWLWVRERVSGTTQVSPVIHVQPVVVSDAAFIADIQIRNKTDVSLTNPNVTFTHGFADPEPSLTKPAAIPSGWTLQVRAADGVTVLPSQITEYTDRKDGCKRWARCATTLSSTTLAAYGTTGDIATAKLYAVPGALNTSGTISPSTVTATSQIYLKMYGGDFAAEIGNGTDYYELDVNDILTNGTAVPWGTNPTRGWILVGGGPIETVYYLQGCVRRHSDQAIHKHLVACVELRVQAGANPRFWVSGLVLMPWASGQHPAGTIGPELTAQPNVINCTPALPRYAGFFEFRDRMRGDALIGACGGPNDERSFVIPATTATFNTTNNNVIWPAAVKGWRGGGNPHDAIGLGAYPTGAGMMFAPEPGGTLPSGLQQDWVYFAGYDINVNCFLYREFSFLQTPGSSGVGPSISNGALSSAWQWAPNKGAIRGSALNLNAVQLIGCNANISGGQGGGTTGSTPPDVTVNPGVNQTISDGTMTWFKATASFGTAGTGNCRVTPVACLWGYGGVYIMDALGDEFWYDPIGGSPPPKTLIKHDFEYLTKQARITPPYRWDPNDIGATDAQTYRYIPNEEFNLYGQGKYDVERAPGDNYDDHRIGCWSADVVRVLYRPHDRNTVCSARAHAAKFGRYTQFCWDYRTGLPMVINNGPDRAGGTYTGFGGIPNPNAYWTVGGSTLGSPTLRGIGLQTDNNYMHWRHYSGLIYSYGQMANGSHMPNPGAGCRIMYGNWLYRHSFESSLLACSLAESSGRGLTGFSRPIYTFNYTVGQSRSHGWNGCRLTQLYATTPTSWPYQAVIEDMVEDLETELAEMPAWLTSQWGASQAAKGIYWGVFNSQDAQGGVMPIWYLGHAFEGPALAAYVFDDDFPGFKSFVNTFMPGIVRIADPQQGGGLYWLNCGYLWLWIPSGASSYSTNNWFTSVQQMLTDAQNADDPGLAVRTERDQRSWSGLNVGEWIDVPVGGQSPWNIAAAQGTSMHRPPYLPGVNVCTNYTTGGGNTLTGPQGSAIGQPFTGYAPRDCTEMAMQIMAPIATASRCRGMDAQFARNWNDRWDRIHQGGMVGPSFSGGVVGVSRAPSLSNHTYDYQGAPRP